MFSKLVAITTLLVSIGYIINLGHKTHSIPDRVELVEIVRVENDIMNVLTGEVYARVTSECKLEVNQPVKIEELRWFRGRITEVSIRHEHLEIFCR